MQYQHNQPVGGGSESFDYVFKLIVIGDSGVGKSALTLRLSDDTFYADHAATIAIDFRMHFMTFMHKRIRLQIWDTAGQERFQSVATAFYRGANGVLLCFDLTSRKSFASMNMWLERVRTQALPGVACILIGCKADMKAQREVAREEAAEWAQFHGMGYVETSAKESDNVVHAFEQISYTILEDQREALERARASSTSVGGAGPHVDFSKSTSSSNNNNNGGCCK
eukprot:PhM_4_TR8034/c0_g1_i1/m.43867/K06109/RAB13; Ras-related protein Rab-13